MKYFLGLFLVVLCACEDIGYEVPKFDKTVAAWAFEGQLKNALEDKIQADSPRIYKKQILDIGTQYCQEIAAVFEQKIISIRDTILSRWAKPRVFDDLLLLNGKIQIYGVNSCHYIYRSARNRYYFNLPFGWANYLLRTDSALIRASTVQVCSVKVLKQIRWVQQRYEAQDYSSIQAENIEQRKNNINWEGVRFNAVPFRQLKQEKKLYVKSVYAHRQTQKITEITKGLYVRRNEMDTLLRHLHNTGNYFPRDWVTAPRWIIEDFIADRNSGEIGLHVMLDTPFMIENTPKYTRSIDVFERMEVEDLERLELMYPDFTVDKIPEIVAYARQKKPTFIYFKRGKTEDEPVAYYFLFYYMDYIPFWGWRLRDLEVVFPRRFLAQ